MLSSRLVFQKFRFFNLSTCKFFSGFPPPFLISIVLFWQNHNYAVDPASLPAGVEVTHINLNDKSCAGLACAELNLMSLQYHPESSPGPHDSDPGENYLLSVIIFFSR